ncbi:MAG TPA: DUF2341 domain-containing protein [Candidatus Thermoplasmatota archaeon]|nr:DUF2341 domain-containing protein [Candidatus Thermoplasmatota archaeon]
MKKSQKNFIMTAGVIIIFILSCNVSSISGTTSSSNAASLEQQLTLTKTENAVITTYASGMPHTQVISAESGLYLQDLLNKLVEAHAENPTSIQTQQLQQQILTYAEQNDLLPRGMSAASIQTQLQKQGLIFASKRVDTGASPALYDGTGKEMFCNFASAGQGAAFPIIILPRFIPFIMTPIPRLFVGWKTQIGFTSCGGLLSQTGFMAYGQQQGFALGFWGIGFSIFLPPINAYGMFGYALFAKTSAEYMEYWPPNNPPELAPVYPLDGASYVPVSTTELQFHISDLDNDLMSYSVITAPDIGGGNGNLKQDGTYSIPVSGLKSLTTYTWTVTVSDGMDTKEETFTFTTEGVAPIVSDLTPLDKEKFVPLTQPFIRFYLRDPQNDPIDYTVETSPDIGSGSGTDVSAGYITIPISGLQSTTIYHWFVNATDGTYPITEEYWFQTEPVMNFDPFAEGWQYRKMVTIDHSLIVEHLSDFPVYIQTVDNDLNNHAQSDGDDILFMDGTGVAHRLWHEIETYDQNTGTLVAWVKLSSIDIINDTVFYLYYGNAGVTSQQFPEQVWDDPYRAVWHLQDNPVSPIQDSSTYLNEGTAYGGMNIGNVIPAKLGDGLQFDGVDDYVGVPDSSSLCPTDVTLSGWYKPLGPCGYPMYVISKASFDHWGNADGHSYGFMIEQDNSLKGIFERDDSQQYDVAGTFYTSLNQWYHLTLTYSDPANVGCLYINGVLQGTVGPCHSTVLWYHQPWDFLIGASRQSTGSSKIPNYFQNCVVDEVHVLNMVKTNGWIATEYNNQNDPATFMSFGVEESGP